MKLIKRVLSGALFLLFLVNAAGCGTHQASNISRQPAISILTGKSETVTGKMTDISLSYENEESMLEDMQLVCQNTNLELYLHPGSLTIAIKNRLSKKIFSTNPCNAQQDVGYSGNTAKDIESQIVLEYLDNNSIKTFWSSEDCVRLGQYSYTLYENGIRAEFEIGEKKENLMVPKALTAKHFDEIISKLGDERSKARMETFYTLYSYSEDKKSDSEFQKILNEYPILKNTDLYVCGDINDRERKDIDQYMREAEYTAETYKTMLEEVGATATAEISPVFKLNVEYALTETGLSVRIPNESIGYDKEHFTLLSVRLLEYFGADVSDENGDGYLFIPDGSGALISINRQAENRSKAIQGRIYGNDPALVQRVESREGRQFYLPVFGVRRNNNEALFAIISSGAEMGEINAGLGGFSSYYTVFCKFIYVDYEQLETDAKAASLGSKKIINVSGKKPYGGDFSVDYHFLTDDDANYSGMAKVYRDALESKGLNIDQNNNYLHMGLETLGSSLYESSFLGFPYDAEAKYTTYEQSQKIAEYFKNNGVERINLMLNGWQKNGLDYGTPNTLKISGALGGKSGLENLSEWARQNSFALYPDIDMLFVNNDRMFDGFALSKDAVRQMDKKYAGKRPFKADIYDFGSLAPAITPAKYSSYWASFFKKYSELGIGGISLGSIGEYLISDFNTLSAYNRGDTLAILDELLHQYGNDRKLVFDGANAYVLPYASVIKNVPLDCSGFSGETYSVPFLQMVVSGYVMYHSQPLNLDENLQASLLGCIESSTSPYFVLAADNVGLLKLTDYTNYYSTDYKILKERVAKAYLYVKDALAPVEGAAMVSHDVLAAGVTCTGYDSGINVYVNRNDEAYIQGELHIPAKGYTTKSVLNQ